MLRSKQVVRRETIVKVFLKNPGQSNKTSKIISVVLEKNVNRWRHIQNADIRHFTALIIKQ